VALRRIGDEGKDPGGMDARYRIRDGFHLDCGLPSAFLTFRPSAGPWELVRAISPRSRKAMYQIFNRVTHTVAWEGEERDAPFARTKVEALNAYELAREFPPAEREYRWTDLLPES